MDDYEVGYGKPPRATRFKPGVSGNPKGRPKRDKSLGKVIHDVLDEPVKYRENGRARTATRRELALIRLAERAMNGDVGAAEMLLRKRAEALRQAGGRSTQLLIRDSLPDYPGQTAAEKARDLGSAIGSQVLVIDDAGLPFSQAAASDRDSEKSNVPEAGDEAAD